MKPPGLWAGAILALALSSPLSAAPRCAKQVDTCIVEKRQAFKNRGVLGFLWAPVAEDERVPHLDQLEYLVRAVPPGYPAQVAGLKPGDLLLEMNGKSLLGVSADTFKQRQESIAVGQVTVFTVLRDGKRLQIRIPAGKPDERSIEAWVGQHILDQHNSEEYRRYLRTLRAVPSRQAPHADP